MSQETLSSIEIVRDVLQNRLILHDEKTSTYLQLASLKDSDLKDCGNFSLTLKFIDDNLPNYLDHLKKVKSDLECLFLCDFFIVASGYSLN